MFLKVMFYTLKKKSEASMSWLSRNVHRSVMCAYTLILIAERLWYMYTRRAWPCLQTNLFAGVL